MSRKTQRAYEACLAKVIEIVRPENLNLKVCIADFEMALRKAIASQIPGTVIVGCNVHYDGVIFLFITKLDFSFQKTSLILRYFV